jgi:hypothetical protein
MISKEFIFCQINLSSQFIMLIIYMIKYTTKFIFGFWTLYAEKVAFVATKSMAVCRDESHDPVPSLIPISTYFKISNHF